MLIFQGVSNFKVQSDQLWSRSAQVGAVGRVSWLPTVERWMWRPDAMFQRDNMDAIRGEVIIYLLF